LCDIFADGDWVESKDQSSEGIRLIQTGNVGEGVFKDRAEKARYISEATFKRLRCTEIFEGDCLISRLPDPVGRSCILPEISDRMITAVDCTIVRFKPNELLPMFFNLYSQSSDYISAVAKECTGTTRSRISRSNLALTPIPVPPLAEQERIVGLLDEAFAGIATAQAHAEKNLHNARALFESHLNEVFTQRGEGWVERRLGDAFETATGTTPPKGNAAYYGNFMPFVKPPELCDAPLDSAADNLSKAGSEVARVLPPNSILVSCIGNLGKVGLNSVAVAFNQQINAILPDETKVDPKLMFYQALSSSFKEELEGLE
jgi:type I restriction enzyme S subunit